MGKVQKATVQVKNINGFHVRPSTAIMKAAIAFKSEILFYKKGVETPLNAKSSLDLLAANIAYQQELEIECKGSDAKEALKKMVEMTEAIYDFKDAHAVE